MFGMRQTRRHAWYRHTYKTDIEGMGAKVCITMEVNGIR